MEQDLSKLQTAKSNNYDRMNRNKPITQLGTNCCKFLNDPSQIQSIFEKEIR